MTLQEEIAKAICDGFGAVAFQDVMPGDEELGIPRHILIHVDGFDEPIKVMPNDVVVPIPPFTSEHAAAIRLDVAALLVSRSDLGPDEAREQAW